MTPAQVLQSIRRRSEHTDELFRVHLVAPGLYARARRLFGSWSSAVRAAGIDYEMIKGLARARSLQTRRLKRVRAAQSRS